MPKTMAADFYHFRNAKRRLNGGHAEQQKLRQRKRIAGDPVKEQCLLTDWKVLVGDSI